MIKLNTIIQKKQVAITFAFITLASVLLMAILFLISLQSPTQAQTSASNFSQNSPIHPNKIIAIINYRRLQLGLPALIPNSKLTQAAKQKAADMWLNKYFAHTSPSGKKFSFWIKEQNYYYRRAGENLAASFFSADKVVAAWMQSPTHRNNLLNPYYQEAGLVVIRGWQNNKPTSLVVLMLAQPLK